jgi:hypothetical protein
MKKSSKNSKQQAAIAISMKAAGKTPKMKSGGSLKPVDASKNPGLAKLPTAVRNKMGYQKNGGQVKMKDGGPKPKSKYIDQADKNLTESMGGPGAKYSMYEMQKREKANNLAEEARRQARMKYPAAASTYVKKPVGFKKGGTVTSKKKK